MHKDKEKIDPGSEKQKDNKRQDSSNPGSILIMEINDERKNFSKYGLIISLASPFLRKNLPAPCPTLVIDKINAKKLRLLGILQRVESKEKKEKKRDLEYNKNVL